jgi:hypothetical protein
MIRSISVVLLAFMVSSILQQVLRAEPRVTCSLNILANQLQICVRDTLLFDVRKLHLDNERGFGIGVGEESLPLLDFGVGECRALKEFRVLC